MAANMNFLFAALPSKNAEMDDEELQLWQRNAKFECECDNFINLATENHNRNFPSDEGIVESAAIDLVVARQGLTPRHRNHPWHPSRFHLYRNLGAVVGPGCTNWQRINSDDVEDGAPIDYLGPRRTPNPLVSLNRRSRNASHGHHRGNSTRVRLDRSNPQLVVLNIRSTNVGADTGVRNFVENCAADPPRRFRYTTFGENSPPVRRPRVNGSQGGDVDVAQGLERRSIPDAALVDMENFYQDAIGAAITQRGLFLNRNQI